MTFKVVIFYITSIYYQIQDIKTKTNKCVKLHDYTMSGFRGVVQGTKT